MRILEERVREIREVIDHKRGGTRVTYAAQCHWCAGEASVQVIFTNIPGVSDYVTVRRMAHDALVAYPCPCLRWVPDPVEMIDYQSEFFAEAA